MTGSATSTGAIAAMDDPWPMHCFQRALPSAGEQPACVAGHGMAWLGVLGAMLGMSKMVVRRTLSSNGCSVQAVGVFNIF